MKEAFTKSSLLGLALFTFVGFSIAQQPDANDNQDSIIPLDQFVGYYNVGVKPNKPFFKSRWYTRDGKLFSIYDSDRDREIMPYQNGKLQPTFFLSEKDVQIKEKDSTYYLVLNFENEQLQSFRVIRPRSEWPTDLYGYRLSQLDKWAIDTERMLTYYYQTKHFDFECSPLDSAQIPALGNYLEGKMKSLLYDFKLGNLPRIKIRVYPSYDAYHNAVLTPNAPKWQRGRAWDKDEIRMLSPITVKEETGEDVQLNHVVLHEFIHCIHLNMVKDGVRVPGWLWEGIAMYKGCCQWVENPKKLDYIKNGRRPTLKQIEKDRTDQMKYDLGYFIIKFLDQEHGWEKVLQLIHSNGQIKEILGVSENDFQKDFYDYIEANY